MPGSLPCVIRQLPADGRPAKFARHSPLEELSIYYDHSPPYACRAEGGGENGRWRHRRRIVRLDQQDDRRLKAFRTAIMRFPEALESLLMPGGAAISGACVFPRWASHPAQQVHPARGWAARKVTTRFAFGLRSSGEDSGVMRNAICIVPQRKICARRGYRFSH